MPSSVAHRGHFELLNRDHLMQRTHQALHIGGIVGSNHHAVLRESPVLIMMIVHIGNRTAMIANQALQFLFGVR